MHPPHIGCIRQIRLHIGEDTKLKPSQLLSPLEVVKHLFSKFQAKLDMLEGLFNGNSTLCHIIVW